MNLLLTLLFVQLCLLAPVFSLADESPCHEQPHIVVEQADAETSQFICDSADKAITFLSRYGLHPQRTIVINIVDDPIMSGRV